MVITRHNIQNKLTDYRYIYKGKRKDEPRNQPGRSIVIPSIHKSDKGFFPTSEATITTLP